MLLTRAEARELDRAVMRELGVPGVVLMENAGRSMAELLLKQGVAGEVAVICGKGNNGGDGFVIARHLQMHGVSVRGILCAEPAQIQGDAAINLTILHNLGLTLQPSWQPQLEGCEWVVDALFGSGFQGEVHSPYREIIDAINASKAKVLAVDIPSGLDADTGRTGGVCVRATITATVVAAKVGFQAAEAKEYLGTIHTVDFGVSREILARLWQRQRQGMSERS